MFFTSGNMNPDEDSCGSDVTGDLNQFETEDQNEQRDAENKDPAEVH